MGVEVLGANTTGTTTSTTTTSAVAAAAAAAADGSSDQWVVVHGQSSAYQACGPEGSKTVPLYGRNVTSWQACQTLCAAHQEKAGNGGKCEVFSWCGPGCGEEWGGRCFGRLDGVWALHPVGAAVSGCDKTLSKCALVPPPPPPLPPPPPPPPPPAVRVFAHCSKATPGAVVFAVAASPCVRDESLPLTFPDATRLTVWMLSAYAPSDDMVALNGRNLTIDADNKVLPSLAGKVVAGGATVHIPSRAEGAVCGVGFVEARYAQPVPACQKPRGSGGGTDTLLSTTVLPVVVG